MITYRSALLITSQETELLKKCIDSPIEKPITLETSKNDRVWLRQCIKNGWISKKTNKYWITERGIKLYNTIK